MPYIPQLYSESKADVLVDTGSVSSLDKLIVEEVDKNGVGKKGLLGRS